MNKWLVGVILAVVAVAALYFAASAARHSPQMSWAFLAVFAASVATIFVLIGRAVSHAGPPPDSMPRPPLTDRAEIPASGAEQHPWAGTARTLFIMGIGLAALLLHTALFAGAAYLHVGWITYVAVGLAALFLILIAMLAAPRGT